VNTVCCQVEVSAKRRSLVQRSPSECALSVCDLETSTGEAGYARVGLLWHKEKGNGKSNVNFPLEQAMKAQKEI